MPQRILFVGDAPHSFREQCAGTLNVDFDTVPWDGVVCERLSRAEFDLAVAFAPTAVASGAALFHWLADNPIGKPMLAVLQPDNTLLSAASRVVDDFVTAPVRDDELRFRLARILGRDLGDGRAEAHERLTLQAALASAPMVQAVAAPTVTAPAAAAPAAAPASATALAGKAAVKAPPDKKAKK